MAQRLIMMRLKFLLYLSFSSSFILFSVMLAGHYAFLKMTIFIFIPSYLMFCLYFGFGMLYFFSMVL